MGEAQEIEPLRYMAPSAHGPVRCSRCRDTTQDLVLRLNVGQFLTGWRRHIPMPAGELPWMGLCETCVRLSLEGFERARRKLAGETP